MSQFWINLRGLFVCWGFMRQNLLGFWKNRLGSLGGWKTSGGLFQTFWHECRQWPERADRAVFKVFLSAAEIGSSLKESSSKQSKEMFLSFLFLQSCQSVCLKWFRKVICSIPAGVHLYHTRSRFPPLSSEYVPDLSVSSSGLRPPAFVLSGSWKFSHHFFFLLPILNRHWPFTCVAPS